MSNDKTCNGWKNYATWNVALWIGNDDGLHSLSTEYRSYKDFAAALREEFQLIETPDHVAYNDSGLDYEALDEMLNAED